MNQNCIVTHKVTNEIRYSYSKDYFLKPGTVAAKNACGEKSPNLYCDSPSHFDIQNGKMILNIPKGSVHLMYYSDNDTEEGILVPDEFRIQDYIIKYITFKLFEQISNQITDETFNQIQQKLMYAEKKSDEAFIMADIESKKQTIQQISKSIARTKNRYTNFKFKNGR